MPTYNNYVDEDYWVSGYAEGDIHSLAMLTSSASSDVVAGERIRLVSGAASSSTAQLTAAMSKFFLASSPTAASTIDAAVRYQAGASSRSSSNSATQNAANILITRALLSVSATATDFAAARRYNPAVQSTTQSTVLATQDFIMRVSSRMDGLGKADAAGATRVLVSGRSVSSSFSLLSARILWEAGAPDAPGAWVVAPETSDTWTASSDTPSSWSELANTSDTWVLIPDNSNNWAPLSN